MSADVLTPTHTNPKPEEDDFSMFLNDDAPLFDGEDSAASLFSADAIEDPSEKKKPAARPTLNNKKPTTKKSPAADKENEDAPAKPEKKIAPKKKAAPEKKAAPKKKASPSVTKKAAAPRKAPAVKKTPALKRAPAKKKAAPKEDSDAEEDDISDVDDPAEEEVVAPEAASDASDEEPVPEKKSAVKGRKPVVKKAPLKKPSISKAIAKPAAKKVTAVKKAPVKKTPVKKKAVAPKPPKKAPATKKKSSLGKRKSPEGAGEGLDSLEDVLITEPRKKTKKVRSAQPALSMTALTADEKQLLMDVIQPRALGVYALEADQITENVTHLVIGGQKRTLKVLLALARGLWIVKPDWLLASVLEGKYAPEEKFEAVEWFPGCKAARLAKKEGKSLFDGEKIYIHKQTSIPREDLEQILLLAGAQVVKAKACTVCVTDSAVAGGLPKGVSCVKSSWVLSSLQQGELLPQEDSLMEEMVDEDDDDDDDDDDADSVVIKSKSPTPRKKAATKSKSPAPKKKSAEEELDAPEAETTPSEADLEEEVEEKEADAEEEEKEEAHKAKVDEDDEPESASEAPDASADEETPADDTTIPDEMEDEDSSSC